MEVTENIHVTKGRPAESKFSKLWYTGGRKDLESRNLNWPLALDHSAWKNVS